MSRDEGYIVLTDWVDFQSMPTLAHKKNPDFCHRGASKVLLHFSQRDSKVERFEANHLHRSPYTKNTVHSWRMRQSPHQWPCWKFLPVKASSWGIRSFWEHHRGPSSNWMSADRCEGFTLKISTWPGALKNCLMRDYHSMRKDPKRGYNMILVPSHKRQVDGPAML